MKKIIGAVAAVAALAVVAGWWLLGRDDSYVVLPLAPGPSQPRVTPGEAGLDPAAVEAASAYAQQRGTHALVVGRGGHIVLEKYVDGVNFDTPVDPGFAPVLAAMAIGVAMSDRAIISLDLPLTHYVGDAAGEWGMLKPRVLLGPDRAGLEPAEATDLLALLLERVYKQPYETLIADRLWRPLGGGTVQFKSGAGTRRCRRRSGGRAGGSSPAGCPRRHRRRCGRSGSGRGRSAGRIAGRRPGRA